MKTDTLHQEPNVGVHASACPAVSELQAALSLSALFNAPTPADPALVSQNDAAGNANSDNHPTIQPSINPLMHLSIDPPHTGRTRNGKIARLPKPVRDLINRMLFNNL